MTCLVTDTTAFCPFAVNKGALSPGVVTSSFDSMVRVFSMVYGGTHRLVAPFRLATSSTPSLLLQWLRRAHAEASSMSSLAPRAEHWSSLVVLNRIHAGFLAWHSRLHPSLVDATRTHNGSVVRTAARGVASSAYEIAHPAGPEMDLLQVIISTNFDWFVLVAAGTNSFASAPAATEKPHRETSAPSVHSGVAASAPGVSLRDPVAPTCDIPLGAQVPAFLRPMIGSTRIMEAVMQEPRFAMLRTGGVGWCPYALSPSGCRSSNECPRFHLDTSSSTVVAERL